MSLGSPQHLHYVLCTMVYISCTMYYRLSHLACVIIGCVGRTLVRPPPLEAPKRITNIAYIDERRVCSWTLCKSAIRIFTQQEHGDPGRVASGIIMTGRLQ